MSQVEDLLKPPHKHSNPSPLLVCGLPISRRICGVAVKSSDSNAHLPRNLLPAKPARTQSRNPRSIDDHARPSENLSLRACVSQTCPYALGDQTAFEFRDRT